MSVDSMDCVCNPETGVVCGYHGHWYQRSQAVVFVRGGRWQMKRGACHNPYENLVLDHIRDEQGKPVRVNSARELADAEKKYNFIHAASHGLEDEAPQHDAGAGDITRDYKRKWQKDPEAYKPENVTGVDVGVAPTAAHTLADKPTSTREVGT